MYLKATFFSFEQNMKGLLHVYSAGELYSANELNAKASCYIGVFWGRAMGKEFCLHNLIFSPCSGMQGEASLSL